MSAQKKKKYPVKDSSHVDAGGQSRMASLFQAD